MDKSYVQLAKPLLAERELELLVEANDDLRRDLRGHLARTADAHTLLLALIRALQLPVRVLQQTCYAYQRFYLFNGNYRKYANSQTDVALAALFTALKANDFIVKLTNVLQEANVIRKVATDVEEQKRIVLSLERKIMEFQSFDFRSPVIEDLLVRFLKLYSRDLPEGVLYLAWTVLNDLYFTKLVVMYPAHLNAVVALRVAVLVHNELRGENVEFDLGLLRFEVDEKDVNNGANVMMECYVDKGGRFFEGALAELGYGTEVALQGSPESPLQGASPGTAPGAPVRTAKRKLQDALINIKIILNNNLPASMPEVKDALKADEFFRPRASDLTKNGSVRFLYNREKYTNEVLYSRP